MSNFADKIGLVTGAGSGIGRAAAIELARQGAIVAVADIDEATAAAVPAGPRPPQLPGPLRDRFLGPGQGPAAARRGGVARGWHRQCHCPGLELPKLRRADTTPRPAPERCSSDR
ncbi:SDR family NAD(P)-dependent oxidoreductase [Nonomuraea angiospora]|uniref:SDR family NAD(P)-dependent oxidoreductase n=1 Tax=Nonomuraea angiospora TaxID=46172 RepID=UPI00298F0541|nr:SDR family NAD(P)-dependent oxidoreductase [Nonomuraea angiospora]